MENKFDEYSAFKEYMRTHDAALKDKIIEHYMYIAEILSKRFANRGIEYDDIYQVACLGLVLAADRFDPDKNVRFASFATPTIMGEIKRYFRDKGFFIKIPRKLYEVFHRAEKLSRAMSPECRTPEELSKLMKIPAEMIKKAYDAGDFSFIQSLEQEAYSDSQLMYLDTVGGDDKSFMMIENKDFFDYCLKSLDEKEREFINLRFYKEYTQKQISELWNVSQMQISRFEKKLLSKLRDLYFK